MFPMMTGAPGSREQIGELERAYAAYTETQYRFALEDRERTRRFEAVMCCCRPMGAWPACHAQRQTVLNPWDNCPVHSVMMVDREGRPL